LAEALQRRCVRIRTSAISRRMSSWLNTVNATSRHETGQGAAVQGPSRPGPLHNPLRVHWQKARNAVSG
jgi:hypothetical protein